MATRDPVLLQRQFAGGSGLGQAPLWYTAAQQRTLGTLGDQIQDPVTVPGDPQMRETAKGVLGDYLKDPWESAFFNQRQATAQEAIANRINQQSSALASNAQAFGYDKTPAFLESQQRDIRMSGSRATSSALAQNLIAADEMRQRAIGPWLDLEATVAGRQEDAQRRRQGDIGMMLGYQPLITGYEDFPPNDPNELLSALLGGGLGAVPGLIEAIGGLFNRDTGETTQGLPGPRPWPLPQINLPSINFPGGRGGSGTPGPIPPTTSRTAESEGTTAGGIREGFIKLPTGLSVPIDSERAFEFVLDKLTSGEKLNTTGELDVWKSGLQSGMYQVEPFHSELMNKKIDFSKYPDLWDPEALGLEWSRDYDYWLDPKTQIAYTENGTPLSRRDKLEQEDIYFDRLDEREALYERGASPFFGPDPTRVNPDLFYDFGSTEPREVIESELYFT